MREQLLTLWPDNEAVSTCIKHEAETLDKAVFLAVHQPMRLLRVGEGTKQGSGQVCTEQDLFAAFMTETLAEGRVILPIEGSSGVGKSHVIRWIDAQLERRADREKRHIIRVPKGMSLKGVLRLLLEGLDGTRYAELREKLIGAREKLDPELAAKYLILNISHRLGKEAEIAVERIRAGEGGPEDRLLKNYGDKRALPALIGDQELLHSHWLVREADGSKGVMARLAEQITEKAHGPEDTRQHQIHPEDLELSQELVERLNPSTQRFYHGLSTRPERLVDAARLINRVLDEAKQDLLQLGDSSLTDLFRDVRKQLLADGKELVLLVEDFAVLSGMQGALFQVMITEATRGGVQELCTMRSALAYTPGVVHVPETVRTRAGSLWSIEDIPGGEEEIHRRVLELVGAYMNAARVGQQNLRDAFEVAGDEESWIPSVDGNDLEDETRALIEAFGVSEGGYPLFPFNAGAIRQLTDQGSRKDGKLVFNPRNVINNVLGKVLPEREAFGKGRFPHPGLAEELRSSDVTTFVDRSIPNKEQRDRILTMLACWGDQPGILAEAAALQEGVFKAFELPYPGWGVSPIHRDLRPPTHKSEHNSSMNRPGTAQDNPRVPTSDPAEQHWKDSLERWGGGQLLSQVQARQLRNWLAQAMLDFGNWGMLPVKLRHRPDYLQRFVYLPQARGQGGLTADDALLVVATEVELDDPATRAGVIRTLMAFVRLHDLKAGWSYAGALEDAALVASFLETHLEHAESYLRSHHFRPQSNTIPALTEALLVGARALGVEGAESRRVAFRVSALFADATEPEEPTDTRWGRELARFAKHRAVLQGWLLEQVGARQGLGAVQALDVTVLEPHISTTADNWAITKPLPEKENDRDFKAAAAALRALRTDLPRTLREHRQDLLAWHQEAAAWFGETPDKKELRDTLRETVNLARKELPRSYDHDALKRRIAELKDISFKGTMADCARLINSEAPGDVLSVLARKPDRVVRTTRALMKEFDRFLNVYESAVDTRLKQLGEDAVADGVAAVQRELNQLRELLAAIQEAR